MEKRILRVLQNIVCKKEIVWFYLKPKDDIYNKTYDNRTFYINEYFIQENWKNIYFEVQDYYKWEKSIENLKNINSFLIDIDIGNDKNCKKEEDLLNKLEELEKKYNFIPHYIIKTRWWYHIYYNIKSLNYKKHKKEINTIYEFLIDFLNWDKKFTWQIWIWKIPWTIDYSYWELCEIKIQKRNNHKKYDLNDMYSFYEKITWKKINIEEIKEKETKKEKIKQEFYKKVNDICALSILDLLWYKVINKKVLWDNSLWVWYNQETKKYYLNDYSWRVKWNFDFILKHFWQNFNETVKFLNKKFWIIFNIWDWYIATNNLIFKVFTENIVKIDYEKIKKDLWDNYDEKLLNNLFNKNWTLSNKINFLLLNILSKNENWKLKNIKFSEIFSNSYLKKENIKVQKKELIKCIELLKYLYIEVNDYKYYIEPDTLVELKTKRKDVKIYILDYFLDNWDKTYSISIFNGLNWIFSAEKNYYKYIPKSFLENKFHLLNLSIFWLKEYLKNKNRKKQKLFPISYVYNIIERTYNNDYFKEMKKELNKWFIEKINNIKDLKFKLELSQNWLTSIRKEEKI